MFNDAGALMCCICYCVIKRSIIYIQHLYYGSRMKQQKDVREQWPDGKDINDISTHNIIEFSC